MSEKTIILPEGSSMGGFDPNLFAALNNGGMGGGWMSNPIWAIVFLAFLRGGFGWNGNEGGCNCNNNYVASQLNQAIAGNANALSNLSTHLDCAIGQVQGAINAVQTSVQNLANQTGMNAMQIVNAINSGDAALANQLSTCCCDIKTAVNTGFGNLRYESAAQTCDIKQSIANQTASVLAKLDAIEDSRKDREIAALTAQNATLTARAERAAELAPIYKAIEKIPNTVPVQWPQLTAIPTAQLYGYGLAGYANGGVFG